MTGSKLSWGRYPAFSQRPHDVFWPDDVRNQLAKIIAEYPIGTLAYGMGRSYGDSCLAASDQVILMSGLSRILSINWEDGEIHAQAGLTLDELIKIAMPFGWFLPVTPGSRFVTIGGAVANDVHGKNHHSRGTFGCHVKELTLYRSDEGEIVCSKTQRPDLFAATIGGLGLTGVILSVKLQLRRVSSSNINQRRIKFNNLDEFFDLSNQFDTENEYSVAWIDCMARGKQAGRGHYILGDHAEDGIPQPAKQYKLKMPFDPPISLVNKITLRSFNALYYHRQRKKNVQTVVNYLPFFYPLDLIADWNKMYGSKGFQQYQCVVPANHSQEAMSEILGLIASSGTGSFLAVLKQFGESRSPGLLSFPMAGTTLALDFPQRKRENAQLFEKLDALVHEAGGRLYPAKDAHMTATHFQNAYQNWQQLEGLRDPQLLSRFWGRVTKYQN